MMTVNLILRENIMEQKIRENIWDEFYARKKILNNFKHSTALANTWRVNDSDKKKFSKTFIFSHKSDTNKFLNLWLNL